LHGTDGIRCKLLELKAQNKSEEDIEGTTTFGLLAVFIGRVRPVTASATAESTRRDSCNKDHYTIS
jgi:hypothetical protein